VRMILSDLKITMGGPVFLVGDSERVLIGCLNTLCEWAARGIL
jgi:hypothetical protein